MIHNLLAAAATVLPMQAITYYPYASRAINDVGLEIATYGTAVPLKASVQAVSRSTYEQYGLDLQKKYITVFIQKNLIDIDRGVSGDKIAYNGATFQVESETDWFAVDNWTYLLAVRID